MKVYLMLDDYNEGIATCVDALKELEDYFDNFKVNLFVSGGLKRIKRKPNQSYCLHGWDHTNWEDVSVANLRRWQYDKIYKAPFWQLSDEMYTRLKDEGWKIMLNPEVEDAREGIRFGWNIKDERPDGNELIAHGHTHNVCGNGIEESLDRIKKLPVNTTFEFLKNAQ